MTDFARIIAMAVTVSNTRQEDILVSRLDLLFLVVKALDMPSWIQYIATDLDGRMVGHETRPRADSTGRWLSMGRTLELFNSFEPSDHWAETLVYWRSDIYNDELDKLKDRRED